MEQTIQICNNNDGSQVDDLEKKPIFKVAYFIPFIQHYQDDKIVETERRAVVFKYQEASEQGNG